MTKVIRQFVASTDRQQSRWEEAILGTWKRVYPENVLFYKDLLKAQKTAHMLGIKANQLKFQTRKPSKASPNLFSVLA
jgi:hypothetical protein